MKFIFAILGICLASVAQANVTTCNVQGSIKTVSVINIDDDYSVSFEALQGDEKIEKITNVLSTPKSTLVDGLVFEYFTSTYTTDSGATVILITGLGQIKGTVQKVGEVQQNLVNCSFSPAPF